MLIPPAYAQESSAPPVPAPPAAGDLTTGTAAGMANLPAAPSPTEAFAWNMGMVLVLVVLFYVLLIMPQQRRFKEHAKMLSGLKKGDKVVTGGGLVGVIDKIGENEEVVVDLGNGLKVTALRSTIQSGPHLFNAKPANDTKKK